MHSIRATFVGALVALVLSACGGGGGDGGGTPTPPSDPPLGPPATAATLSTSAADASDAARTAVSAADGLAGRYSTMTGFTALLGVPIAAEPATPSAVHLPGTRRAAWPDGRARRLDVTTEACTEFVDPPCTGTITVDTNVAQTATSVTPGNYLDATFNSLSGLVLGRSVTFTGRMRIEFLTALNLNNPQLPGLGLRIKFTGFAGTLAGSAFGPVSETADFNFSSQGVGTLTTGGARYGSLAGVSVTGAGAYTINTGDVRRGFGASTTAHVDTHLTNWRNLAGRPVVGSSATLTAGSTSASVQVTASSSTTVVYAVSIVSTTGTRAFTVTATYPAGGGAPTYSAV
jgi:hypothetical protein